MMPLPGPKARGPTSPVERQRSEDADSSFVVQQIADELLENPIERGGPIYHPIPYPEFDHLGTSTKPDEAERKLELVLHAIRTVCPGGVQGAKVLDVGARGGYHTFTLDQMGAHVTAFEPHPRYGHIGKILADVKAENVKWHPKPLDLDDLADESFDVAIMLSVFQWMAAGGERYEMALRELRGVSNVSTALVFELGFNYGRSCVKTRKRNHYAHLINMLRGNTRYENFQYLGETRAWDKGRRYVVLCSNIPGLDDHFTRRIIRSVKV